MKRCPTCNRTFNDPALSFCTADGTPLLADSQPAYQQPAPPPPPYQAPGQQGYTPTPQMSFGQQAAGRSAGFAKAALILGLISLFLFVVAMLRMLMRWQAFRYNYSTPTDVAFWACFVIGLLLLLLAVLLGLVGLIQSLRNPARYGGKAVAFFGPFLGVLAAVLTVGVFSYARVKAPSSPPYTNYNYNSNTYSSNSNTYSSNGSTNSSRPSSPSAMSDDDKYRLFFAASKTGDQKLILQCYQKIGLFDQNGRPTEGYKDFIKGSFSWAMRDTAFIQSISTPDKAREYVMAHL